MRTLPLAALCCTLATTAAADDNSFVWHMQSGAIACSDMSSLIYQSEAVTPSGVQNIQEGCWLVGTHEISSYGRTGFFTNADETVAVIFREAVSIRLQRRVLLLLRMENLGHSI